MLSRVVPRREVVVGLESTMETTFHYDTYMGGRALISNAMETSTRRTMESEHRSNAMERQPEGQWKLNNWLRPHQWETTTG